jgi:hypothetical protein
MEVSLAQIILEVEGGETFLSHDGARAGLILLASLAASFLLIRVSVRLMRDPRVTWWPGSIKTEGGIHLHHLVFGIFMMLIAGFVMALQPGSPWFELMAALFGVGAGLTLDEFALWVHLDDVYWAEEGRQSVDAVIITVILGGLLLLGFLPFSTDDSAPGIVVATLINLLICGIAISKGKVIMGVAGILFPLIGLIGAIRIAKPHSPWANRFYDPGSKKLAKAEKRFARHERRYQRFQDQIAGAPTAPAEPTPSPPAD